MRARELVAAEFCDEARAHIAADAAGAGCDSDVGQRRDPVITSSGCWPVVLAGDEIRERFETFSEALDAFYPKVEGEKKEGSGTKPRLSREEVIRQRHGAA